MSVDLDVFDRQGSVAENETAMFKFSLIIPTLNAANDLPSLLESLSQQTVKPNSVIIIDSSSVDATPVIASNAGAQLVSIERSEFNHGATRSLALKYAPDAEILVFMTQDAVLASSNSLENLLTSFMRPTVCVAYGRQLPRTGAGPIESFARHFNYPDSSYVRTLDDVPTFGIKTCFTSNSFAAYRTASLQAIGGFRSDVIFGEDMLASAQLIRNGGAVAYEAEATVLHSHDYSIVQEFRRCFDIGVMHSKERELLAHFGKASKEGAAFVKSELRYISIRDKTLLPEAILRTFFKLLGYKLGSLEAKLPSSVKRYLSMNRRYWSTV